MSGWVLKFLGTGATFPSASRNLSTSLLNFQGRSQWMFDCGEGTQTQLVKTGDKIATIDRIYITHNHLGHLMGLPGVISARSYTFQPQPSQEVLEIFGPVGIRSLLRTCFTISDTKLASPFRVHELLDTNDRPSADREATIYGEQVGGDFSKESNGSWVLPGDASIAVENVVAAKIAHSIATFGYVVNETVRPGATKAELIATLTANQEALRNIGITSLRPIITSIKRGEIYTLPDGSIIDPSKYLGESQPSRKITILGDTSDAFSITPFALNSNYLVHEATYISLFHKGMSASEIEEKAVGTAHSSEVMAARFAQSINAKNLILTHLPRRFENQVVHHRAFSTALKTIEATKSEYQGVVHIAYDGLAIPLVTH